MVLPENFQHILRVMNTNIAGEVNIIPAMTAIKGVGRRYSTLCLKKAEIDVRKRAGELVREALRSPARKEGRERGGEAWRRGKKGKGKERKCTLRRAMWRCIVQCGIVDCATRGDVHCVDASMAEQWGGTKRFGERGGEARRCEARGW